ncbi:MAG: hypothetical protein PHN69_03645 [Candidatus Pacebacteria bacterium]|nr:hypothetical protein [Fermentimonas sp.]MDD4804244.1 hypothetical protein [Candidatus Paceibacterota bacterium]
MVRGKNIGGFTEDTKIEFMIRKTRGKFKNTEEAMIRFIALFDKYNAQYEAELKKKKD